MRPGTERRIRLFVGVLVGGALIGAGYGALIGFAGWNAPLTGSLIGIVHGVTIAASIGLLEIFVTRTALGRRLDQAPLAVTILGKALVYGAVVAGVEAGDLGERVISGRPGTPPARGEFFPLSVAFSFVFTLAFIFVLQIGRLVGERTLRDLVLGRYHRPRMEQRFFLFVDVVGSTEIAERVGPLAVHRFLARIFSLAAEPVADHHGEIHQYVGDQMVVTWTLAEGRLQARPVACLFAIEDALARAAPGFEREFGTAPRVRAALHAGTVVTGEVGDSKRDLVFHGDVMNAAARLEGATRELGRPFLISADAQALLLDAERYGFEDLGPRGLRGRAAPVQVLAVTREAGAGRV